MTKTSRPTLPISDEQALALAENTDSSRLCADAVSLRDAAHGNLVTYSKKIFIPLTHLCRDVCHYCTFAKTPRHIEQAYMSVEQVLELCRQGAELGCQEALLTLGEKPELRYKAAREALQDMGFTTTIEYVTHIARCILKETGILPHINAGNMDAGEMAELRKVSASMGIMLESASSRLCEKGMPHYGSPDKDPATRLETIALAGEADVPFTTGILIGIGETRLERIESLLEIRRLHEKYGHIQEIIVQNFRAKPDTKMAQAPEPDLEELLWSIAVARIIFGSEMNIQAPPNLSPGVLAKLVDAGINDWGGVSPLTPDHVNPEAPWPHLQTLARETQSAGKFLDQRLTLYPFYVQHADKYLAEELRPTVLRLSDSDGLAKRDDWSPGTMAAIPELDSELISNTREHSESAIVSGNIKNIVNKALGKGPLSEQEITSLFESRGDDFAFVISAANELRKELTGNSVSYIVNRNINYTNVCYFKCQFCAFSKGKASENLRGKPYDISADEIARRCKEAWDRGATEVCMQGGIHPDYTGQTYVDIVETVRAAVPEMHIHAFSPLEVWQGAETLGISLDEFLARLKEAGLNTLPGTAAEVLDDEVRQQICADKLNSEQWLEVMQAAHRVGFNTTATIMFGHVDRPLHWARHLLKIRNLQQQTGGFTEFVPLPYVAMEAPMYTKGKSRKGPSFRESMLMHSIARLVFSDLIPNIQASWVKLGTDGVTACLNAGANDVGGSLMNESITRAAGSDHGQEWHPANIEDTIRHIGRVPRMRNTLYADAAPQQRQKAMRADDLSEIDNNAAGKKQRSKKLENLATTV